MNFELFYRCIIDQMYHNHYLDGGGVVETVGGCHHGINADLIVALLVLVGVECALPLEAGGKPLSSLVLVQHLAQLHPNPARKQSLASLVKFHLQQQNMVSISTSSISDSFRFDLSGF